MNINHKLYFFLFAIIVFTVQCAQKPLSWFHFPAITGRIEEFTRKITLFCRILNIRKITLLVVCK